MKGQLDTHPPDMNIFFTVQNVVATSNNNKNVLPSTADGPSSVVITGVDTMTLGMTYEFECSASCYPACQFTWSWGKETSPGPKLSLQLEEPEQTQNLTCTALNPTTETSVAAQKTLHVIGKEEKERIPAHTCVVLRGMPSTSFQPFFRWTNKHTCQRSGVPDCRSGIQLHLLGRLPPLLQLLVDR